MAAKMAKIRKWRRQLENEKQRNENMKEKAAKMAKRRKK
jgi:hypothetical protein